MMLDALKAGLGIAFLPEFIIGDALETGTLVRLLHDWSAPRIDLQLVLPPSPLRPKRVDLLLAFLAEELARVCAGQ